MARGRPKEFDEAKVLAKAMDLFWVHGYKGIGLTELLKGMGIARQSLYDTYGNKRQLFIRTIEYYRDTQLSQALALLQRKGSAIKNVKEVVRFFERLARDPQCRGCLVANTLVEMGPHDSKISTLLKETLGLLEEGFCKALTRARKEGELSRSKSPKALSKALTNAVIGMAVTGKLNMDRAALSAVMTGTLSMLD